MTETHLKLKSLFEDYLADNDRFENAGVKVAAGRARKALMEITKMAKTRRAEIQEKKNNM